MLIILSPAKTLDYDSPAPTTKHTLPEFIPEASELVNFLRSFNQSEIANLMDISDVLAALNVARYANWSPEFTARNAKQALFAFNGDVYEALDAYTLKLQEIDFAQQTLRILSGLYGVLRPLDWIQPYRLEMGTRLQNPYGKDLYAFWSDRITQKINQILSEQQTSTVLNLSSNEYFKAIKRTKLHGQIITPIFEDSTKGGVYKIISFYAKQARGLMARYIIEHQIENVEQVKDFTSGGYAFVKNLSTTDTWVFRRHI
jgi:cytoplasmic iron level regulating protein YaaA (DUF328/UPF0246 family)